jgi:hypothetical protein
MPRTMFAMTSSCATAPSIRFSTNSKRKVIGRPITMPSKSAAPKRRRIVARFITVGSTPERTSSNCSVLHVAQ